MIEIVAKIVVITSILNQVYINITRQHKQKYIKLAFVMQIYQAYFCFLPTKIKENEKEKDKKKSAFIS